METNKIYQGDCLKLMKEIEDKSIDLILCDLPYGTTACKWDSIIPLDKLWNQYKRIIKINGAIVLTACQPFTSKLIMSNINNFKYCWIWIKSRGTGHLSAKLQPLRIYEDIIVFYKLQPNYNPILTDKPKEHIRINNTKLSNDNINVYGKNKTTNRYDRREIPIDKNYPINILYFNSFCRQDMVHPTQKPVALFEYLIKTYTNEGDLVLDNCIGSGTTAIACIKTKRNFIGIELSPEYCKIANDRINEELLNSLGEKEQ